MVYNGTATSNVPEVSKPELSKEVSKSEDQPEVKTEVKPEPETTKKETKTATEVPEPSGIEPFKETYFDEDNHVHYFRQVQIFDIVLIHNIFEFSAICFIC